MKVFIPFRLREGGDLRRPANLEIVQMWWYAHGFDPRIVSDGGSGDDQFNRHKAYNNAVAEYPDEEVYIFTEADMLVPETQIRAAARLAAKSPGLVVPFKQYRYLSDSVTSHVRDTAHDMDSAVLAEWWSLAPRDPNSIFTMNAESIMDDGKSIGAVNVVSRETLDLTCGFTEATEGNWYDDNIIESAFSFLAGRTRWVDGPAVHLYHIPGHMKDDGDTSHLSEADRQATMKNKIILANVKRDIRMRNADAVRRLMAVRR